MKLILQRRIDTGKQTLGVLSVKDDCSCNLRGKKLCYILEDTYRPVKVKHKTRIPSGIYQLKLRTYGSHFERYKKKFPELNHNRGMIQVMDVENFTDILIHIGNTETDTSGCLLVGQGFVESDGEVSLANSTVAYKMVYSIIANVLETKKDVTLEIIDELELSSDEINNLIKGAEL